MADRPARPVRAVIASGLLALATAAPSGAATRPDPPAAGSWSIDVGAAALHAPVYFGSRRKGTDIFPQLGFTYGTRLQGSLDDGVRWSALREGPVRAGPVIEYRQSDRFQKVLPGRGLRNAVEAGGFVQVDTPVAQIEGRVRKAITGYGGWSADLSADTGIDIGRLTLGAEARMAWADRSFVYNLYGAQARGRRERGGTIEAPSYLTAGVEADIGYHLAPRLTLGLLVAHDRFIRSIDSDARQRHGATQVGTAISYHFGTAPAR